MEKVLKAEIAVPIPIDKTLTYLVPEEIADALNVGMRVVVPVKNKMVTGFVVDLRRETLSERNLKTIKQMADEKPVVNAELIRLAEWISDYYVSPLGEVLAATSPPPIKLKLIYRLKALPRELEMEILRVTSPERSRIIDILHNGKPLGLETIKRKSGSNDVVRHLEALEREGWIKSEVVARRRRRRTVSASEPATPMGRLLDEHELTRHQQVAYDGITSVVVQGDFKVFLLLGVTGSGKTEVYLRCIDEVLRRGKKAIYLVPEIALTPQIMERVRNRFGARCALVHSRLSEAERYATWQKIMSGNVDVVVGARSAVFAPQVNLGMIVVDEEHDTSYKQQDSPRYNAREVAIMRARQSDAVVILGSATPTIETYHNAIDGKYGFYELPERISGGTLPEVCVVDMRSAEGGFPISNPARESIGISLDRRDQVLLFLNRRGFSHYVQCRDCGLVPRCRNCYVTLTYHLSRRELKCHYCGYTEKGWDLCPKCGGTNIEYAGSGTQRIEDYVVKNFPGSSCARFDRDATRKKGSTEGLLTDFNAGLLRLLVGTQMVAKGHDFKGVGLVVVVNADVTMNLPDFRSGERTFQILTQVAGRAGRGDVPGKVIIQTFNPDHHSLSHVACHDFKGFYDEEVELRKELHYPPFARLVRVTTESRKEQSARKAAEELAKIAIHQGKDLKARVDVIGPSRAPIPKIKNVYRWHLILKGHRKRILSPLVKECVNQIKASDCGNAVLFNVDVDPQTMI